MNLLRLLALSLLLAPLSANAWPELPPPEALEKTGANDVALLIGVEDYAYLPDIPGAKRNVDDWEKYLTKSLGVPHVVTLRDADVTREEILAQAKRLTEQDGVGTLWIVFVGHGATDTKGDGALLGVDAQNNVRSVDARSVKRSEVLSVLAQGKQAKTVAVLDTCFSGLSPQGEHLVPGTQPVVPLRPLEVPANTLVFTAAASDQVAGPLPGAERPAYSYLLLGALHGWADQGDGQLTAMEAHEFTTRQLSKAVGRTQTPGFWGDGQSVLVKGELVAYQPESSLWSNSPSSVAQAASEPKSEPSPTTHDASVKREVQTDQPKPDSWDSAYYFGAFGGLGFEVKNEVTVPWVGARLGAKTADFGPFSLRSGVEVAWTQARNPRWSDLQGGLDQLSAETDTPTWRVNDGDKYHRISIAAGPGLSWRNKTGPGDFHDFVVGIDAVGGVQFSPAGRCVKWSANSETFEADCESNEDVPALATAGLRGSVHWNYLSLGMALDAVPATGELFLGATLGFSLDP